MKKYFEFPIRVYIGQEIEKFWIKQDENLDQDPLLREAKEDEIAEPPQCFHARCKVNPDEIYSYHEVFSLKESSLYPDEPKFDSTFISMKNGEEYVSPWKYDRFERALEAFYSPDSII